MDGSASTSKTVIDLTVESSDDEVLAQADDSVQFVAEVRTQSDSVTAGAGIRPSTAYSHQTSHARSQQSSPWQTTSRRYASSRAGAVLLDDDLQERSPPPIDLDMGDETRQLLLEAMEQDESLSEAEDDEDDATPLAKLSLASPVKRPRGRPPKLALASSPAEDDDSAEAMEDDEEGDDDDVEPEPDSLFLSATLSCAIVEAVKADTQLWDRVLRFEPIPLEELTSCANKAVSMLTKQGERTGNSSGKSSSTSSAGKMVGIADARALREWNSLLSGPQRRIELAIQSWADEQGICSYSEDSERNRKTRSKGTVKSKTGPRPVSPSRSTTARRGRPASPTSSRVGAASSSSSPSKRRRS